MKIIKKESKEITLSEIHDIVKSGRAKELLPVGTQITVLMDGKEVLFDVIGIDREKLVDKSLEHSITIQMHGTIEERAFKKRGSGIDGLKAINMWKISDIREYLNSEEFAHRFAELVPYTQAVEKDTDGTKTVDRFFLLSREEFGDETDEEAYEYYSGNAYNRVKTDDLNNPDWHWTRSAHRGHANLVWHVSSSGAVSGHYANYALRCTPACVIA